jgi:hypothetical protein
MFQSFKVSKLNQIQGAGLAVTRNMRLSTLAAKEAPKEGHPHCPRRAKQQNLQLLGGRVRPVESMRWNE